MTLPHTSTPHEWVDFLLNHPDPLKAWGHVEESGMQEPLVWYLLASLYPERMSMACTAAIDAALARYTS